MITKNNLNEMKNADIKHCDIDDLVDIRDVKVNSNLTLTEKLIDFMEQIKNPYLFKVGDTIVKVKFSDTTQSFQQKMENLITAKIAR